MHVESIPADVCYFLSMEELAMYKPHLQRLQSFFKTSKETLENFNTRKDAAYKAMNNVPVIYTEEDGEKNCGFVPYDEYWSADSYLSSGLVTKSTSTIRDLYGILHKEISVRNMERVENPILAGIMFLFENNCSEKGELNFLFG